MRVFIKEWPNKTATIMTWNGQVIWTYSSVEEARQACEEWRCIIDYEMVDESTTDVSGNPTCACLT